MNLLIYFSSFRNKKKMLVLVSLSDCQYIFDVNKAYSDGLYIDIAKKKEIKYNIHKKY